MREAIEKVIADLELMSFAYSRKYLDHKNRTRKHDGGVEDGLDIAINKLKEVLRENEVNNSNSPNGNGTNYVRDDQAD